MFPVSLSKTHPSTFNKLDADLWKTEALLCVLFIYHTGLKMKPTDLTSSEHYSWSRAVSGLFFFFFLSAARRKRSILPHNLAAGFIFQSSGGATLTAQNTIHTPEHTNSSQTNMFKSLCANNVIITCKIKCDPINLTPFVLRCFISDVIQCTPVCLFN